MIDQKQRRVRWRTLFRDNRYLLTYMFGLALVAIAVTTSSIITDRQLALTKQAQQILKGGYEQNLLLERINHLAYRLVFSHPGRDEEVLSEQLLVAVERMQLKHQRLTRSGYGRLYSEIADDIYFGQDHELDLQLRTYIGAARELAGRNGAGIGLDNPLLRFLDRDQTERLKDNLRLALNLYEASFDDVIGETQRTLWWLYGITIVVVSLQGAMVFVWIFRGLQKRAEEYRQLAQTDPLTGCRNRRSFMQAANKFHESVCREDREGSLLIMDIDRFKQVNDTYGHPVGDEVIRTLVDVSLRHLRSSDLLGRLGGEEFAVLLRDTPIEKAVGVAESLRSALAESEISLHGKDEGSILQFTVSVGVASLRVADDSPLESLERADVALYKAKTSGRNQVVRAE